jgi:hypothetical protein
MVPAASTGLVSATQAQISHQGHTALAASDLATNGIGEHLHEFPLRLSGELCWGKDTFAASNPVSYMWELNNEHKAELSKALGHYKGN